MRRKFGDRAKTVSVHWTGSQALRHVHILRRARQIRSILKLGSRQSVGIKLSAAKMRACRAGMEQLLGLRLEAIEDMLLGLSSQGWLSQRAWATSAASAVRRFWQKSPW
ncbi:unnamed protein product [Effrenium voratum]|nr:unnamed protein product [Effrenium voratum]